MSAEEFRWPGREWQRALRAIGGAASTISADVPLGGLEQMLRGPALCEFDGGYLAVATSGRLVGPGGVERRVSAKKLAAFVRSPFEVAARRELEPLTRVCGERAVERLAAERIMAAKVKVWAVDMEPNQGGWRGVPALVSFHSAQYLLWLASWGVLGWITLSGQLDRAWLQAWALLLLTLAPFRVLTTWTQGLLALRWGARVKRQLLQGALKLEPEEVCAQGIGSFLGQALEADEIENLAISGGIGGLLVLVEMIPALWVLGRLSIVLALWCALALLAGGRFLARYRCWTRERMGLSQSLVESMEGYRTRLVQQGSIRHEAEDVSLAHYLKVSTQVDTVGGWLIGAIPRGWLLVGLAALAPMLTAGRTANSQMAILLGGVLLAFSAFQRLTASCADVAGAMAAWQRIKPLLDAAQRPLQKPAVESHARSGSGLLLEARRLTFRYPGQAVPALRGCDLEIRRGDRILLEGPSGGGKTTLGAVLSGLLKPESGLLLIAGLDRHTLGEAAWRKRVASAPQFHDNHVLTGTLAFNLLMGRHWPPTESDLEEALDLCQELGLGSLIVNMPNGLQQMVGEGGWQLSHGERSRIFLARALLQGAELVVLDESFAALDPENLRTAMETTLRRTPTLLVIAHP